ncbi:hypothetical protein KDAU_21060 [Dictyobacter aurantiacus]|uniref:Uncharacterized protein n=1 Tax=Dictyobacter aurantiacus TaxID=1936993 RepID=A0A401ZD20_9CHLR|nr:hypothetical protein KDAU_21060 [Dictyobacter aurantiacus]
MDRSFLGDTGTTEVDKNDGPFEEPSVALTRFELKTALADIHRVISFQAN